MSNIVFTDADAIKIGSKYATRITDQQGRIIWQEPDYPGKFALKFTAEEDSTIQLNNHEGKKPVLYWSSDGITYSRWNYGVISITQGDSIYIKGNNPRGLNEEYKYSTFGMTGKITCSGNIMHLLGRHIESLAGLSFCFLRLFQNCKSLMTPPLLPATELERGCYHSLFYGCTNLRYCPELPASNIMPQSYWYMFQNCASIEESPVFNIRWFGSDAIEAPVYMFFGCTNLKKVTCYAEEVLGSSYSRGWLYGVSSTGTFIKKRGAIWPSGEWGIPTGWMVIEVD